MSYQCQKCGTTSYSGPNGIQRNCSSGGKCVWVKISRFVKHILSW